MNTSIEHAIQRSLDECIYQIEVNARKAGKVATGKTLAALNTKIRAEGTRIIGELWGLKHTGALETGSQPAKRRGTDAEREAMVKNLKEWCAIRGLSAGMTEAQAENLARYLAWYIKRNGSQLYRQGGRRDIITPAIEATKNTLKEELSIYFDTLLHRSVQDAFFTGHVDIYGNSRY